MANISIGDQVLVRYSLAEGTNNPAFKLNGQVFTVKSIRMPRCGKAKRQYTLYGAESDAGMPFWFLDDELIVL